MNGNDAKGLVMAMGLLMLAGCGNSPEDELYEAFKCGKVATLLEREKDGDMALANAIPYMTQMEADGGNPARVALEMNQRFQDDVPLHRLAIGGQMAMLSDIYQSDECQELYKPANGLTQAGDVNLAGCKVPAGLTPEQAEKIECAKVDPVPVVPAVMEPEAAGDDSANALAAGAVAAADEAAESVKGHQSISPSFDCDKAASRVERLICGDPQLAQADKGLAKAYEQANACTTDKVRLRAAQRTWMTDRNACTDETCVADEYMRRSADLAAECAS